MGVVGDVEEKKGKGGLGYEKPEGKKKKEKGATAALKERGFEATASGAVAAGHWDPWARPVEFKMKAANRTVGGLYSMFVKGGVEGNTIGSSSTGSSSSAAAPAAAAASPAAAFNWKRAIKAELRPHTDGLKVKVLRKAVLAAYARHAEGAPAAAALSVKERRKTFKVKLKKIDAVAVEKKLARLK